MDGRRALLADGNSIHPVTGQYDLMAIQRERTLHDVPDDFLIVGDEYDGH
jgi:hypothetical protein